jgi:hypothetical protein
VALGASKSVLEQFSFSEMLEPAMKRFASGTHESSVLKLIPSIVIEEFSILKCQHDLPAYLDELRRLRVDHVVFAYPQGYSMETIRELANALVS